MFAHQPGVICSSTRNDVDPVDFGPDVIAEDSFEPHFTFLVDTTSGYLTHDLRLLVDLLPHEVFVATAFGGIDVPVDMHGHNREFLAVAIDQSNAFFG